MKKPFKPNEELISLNEELHTEFSIQELEQRLETDPLMFANLLMEQEATCTVAGALSMCQDGGNLCILPDSLTGDICEIKLKGDFCSPIVSM